MSRLKAIDPNQATGKAKELLGSLQVKLGSVPNIFRTIASSPALLEGFLNFNGALQHGLLPAALREQISLAMGEYNSCTYCVSAHSMIGKGAGLSEDQIMQSRKWQGTDPKASAVLAFVRQMLDNKGHSTEAELQSLRTAGLSDGEIAEVVGNVAVNIFTNYFNHTADTEVDFPLAKPLS